MNESAPQNGWNESAPPEAEMAQRFIDHFRSAEGMVDIGDQFECFEAEPFHWSRLLKRALLLFGLSVLIWTVIGLVLELADLVRG